MVRAFLVLLMLAAAAPAAAQNAALESLLAADRAFGTQAARAADPVTGLAPMLDNEAWMAVAGQARAGREAVLAALRTSPNYREGHLSWAPIRAGISADGTQGFTFGYASLDAGDPARRQRKYLAYWVRRPEGWRVAAYRQTFRQQGEAVRTLRAPSLPGRAVRGAAADHQASLAAAEQAFSDRAQRVGLRAAFAEFGREDAVNLGGPADFTYGAEAISRTVDQGEPVSAVNWSTDRSLVAGSGDLGVSIGTIRLNQPAAEGQPSSFPFFTVWRRDGPDRPWRYIAE